MVSLHTISITVKDLAKALSFYRTLGLSIPEEQDNEPHFEYISDNGYSIGFIPETTMLQTNPTWKASAGNSRIGLQFSFDSPEAVYETYKKLLAADYNSYKEPWDAFWGQRFAQVTDPDGNNVGIFSTLN